jgi:hypothetical protein
MRIEQSNREITDFKGLPRFPRAAATGFQLQPAPKALGVEGL